MATIPYLSLLRGTPQGDEYYILPGSAYEDPGYLQAKQKYDALLQEAKSKYSGLRIGSAIKYLDQAPDYMSPYGYFSYVNNPAGTWTEHADAPDLRSYAQQLKATDYVPYLTRQAVATGKAEYDRLQQLTPWGYTPPKPITPTIVDDSNKSYEDILKQIETTPAPEPIADDTGYDYTFDMMRADYEKSNPTGNFDAYIDDELEKLRQSGNQSEYLEALEFTGRSEKPTAQEPSQAESTQKEETGFSDYLKNFEQQLIDQGKAEAEAANKNYEPSELLQRFRQETTPENFENIGEDYKPSPFLQQFREEMAQALPPGPRGYEPPGEILPNRLIPLITPGSSYRPGEGYRIEGDIDFKETGPGLSQEQNSKTSGQDIAHLTAPFQGPSDPLNRKYDPVMKEWVPNVDPGKVLNDLLKKAGAGQPLRQAQTREEDIFKQAVSTASKTSDKKRAEEAFQSEYDPQKAKLATLAADEYRASAQTKDPFRSPVFG